ncbi:MAG: hypothetical protein QGI63_03260 [Rhodospirillales bacterium]|nr:hypothetical protein [Rhodospirillales bacterium]MDP6773266.1 hypothetical protein [Rhodospirillales bacterium]
MTGKAGKRGTPPPDAGQRDAGQREARINAGAAKVVAALIVLYMFGVAGFFVYDHLF